MKAQKQKHKDQSRIVCIVYRVSFEMSHQIACLTKRVATLFAIERFAHWAMPNEIACLSKCIVHNDFFLQILIKIDN